ncbi:hypothetical protein SALBM135S_07574 [Streptomyces alboniger]
MSGQAETGTERGRHVLVTGDSLHRRASRPRAARTPERVRRLARPGAPPPWASRVDVVRGDVTDAQSPGGCGIDVAYYLVHALTTGPRLRGHRPRGGADLHRAGGGRRRRPRGRAGPPRAQRCADRGVSPHLRSPGRGGDLPGRQLPAHRAARWGRYHRLGSASFEMSASPGHWLCQPGSGPPSSHSRPRRPGEVNRPFDIVLTSSPTRDAALRARGRAPAPVLRVPTRPRASPPPPDRPHAGAPRPCPRVLAAPRGGLRRARHRARPRPAHAHCHERSRSPEGRRTARRAQCAAHRPTGRRQPLHRQARDHRRRLARGPRRIIEGVGGDNGWYSFPAGWADQAGWTAPVGASGRRAAGTRHGCGSATRSTSGGSRRSSQAGRLRVESTRICPASPGWRRDRDAAAPATLQKALFHPRGLLGHAYWWSAPPALPRRRLRRHGRTSRAPHPGGRVGRREQEASRQHPARATEQHHEHLGRPLHLRPAGARPSTAAVPPPSPVRTRSCRSLRRPGHRGNSRIRRAEPRGVADSRGRRLRDRVQARRAADVVDEVRAARPADGCREVHMAGGVSGYAHGRERRLREALQMAGGCSSTTEASPAPPPGAPAGRDSFAVFTPHSPPVVRQEPAGTVRAAAARRRHPRRPLGARPRRDGVDGVAGSRRGGESEGRARWKAWRQRQL